MIKSGKATHAIPAFIIAVEVHLMATAVWPAMSPPLDEFGFMNLRKVLARDLKRV
jgi:hypothetical protein